MKTTTWAKPGTFEQKWYVLDAQDYILGRMASKIAMMLMGKHKPIYTPFIDTGDYVIVVNAETSSAKEMVSTVVPGSR